jgi:hypothetical protein
MPRTVNFLLNEQMVTTRRTKKVTTKAVSKKAEVVVKEVSYKEKQVAHLCPKHALNHVLQEEKIVWVPNKPFLLSADGSAGSVGSVSAKDTNVKINLWGFCKDRGLAHLRAQRDEYLHEDAARLFRQSAAGEPNLDDTYYKNPKYTKDFPRDLEFWKANEKKYGGKSIDQIVAILDKEYGKDESLEQLEEGGIGCTMDGVSRGDLPFAWFRDIFDLLGYQYIEVDDLNYKTVVGKKLETARCLGMVINQGAWHYVAVPKFVASADCNARKFVLADSLKGGIFECHSKRELLRSLEVLPLTRAYLLFAKDKDAYQSVAVQRMLKKIKNKRRTKRV